MNARSISLSLLLSAAALACGLAPAPAGAQKRPSDWPQFRGLGARGQSGDRNLPVTVSVEKNLLWKADLPGSGTSSPIVVGPRVFVTCYSGFGEPGDSARVMTRLQLHVVCLGRDDGKVLWTRPIKPDLPEQSRIRENHGYASGTPAADAERLYVSFGRSGVLAFDHAGKELWRAKIGTKTHGWGSAASPVVAGETVLVNACVESGSLIALDRKTGKELWRRGGMKESWNTPILAEAPGGKTEVVVAIFGKVLGIDPADGEPLWSCATDIRWYMVPTLVAGNGVVYAIGGKTGGGALAVRLGGRGDVTASRRIWTAKKGSNVPSPILHDGHLYWVNERSGTLFCAEAATGRIVYEKRLERAGGFYASPVMGDGKIYYLSRGGRMFVVAAKPTFECLAVNDPPERGRYDATPALAGGRILIRTHRSLYCFGN